MEEARRDEGRKKEERGRERKEGEREREEGSDIHKKYMGKRA